EGECRRKKEECRKGNGSRSACIPHSAFCILHFHSWGEGELARRTDAAAQNAFGTRETEPQFLAALDKNVRAPEQYALRNCRRFCCRLCLTPWRFIVNFLHAKDIRSLADSMFVP
ncbi:MAG: hypothetical protein WCK27_32320, partial [Verrucomicrobiota bacterium]